MIEDTEYSYDDLAHTVAWDWFNELDESGKDKVSEDVDNSVSIWHNRFNQDWRQDLENYVKQHIG